MKLQELGLEHKPETKYFDGGYVSFSTDEQELYFEIIRVEKTKQYLLSHGHITNKNQFNAIMAISSLSHALVVITS